MAKAIVVKDKTKGVIEALRQLVGEEVLVGIPDSKTNRTSGQITNAALGYIHEFGSPAANIPARPFLVPGVSKARTAVIPHLRQACEAALEGKKDKAHSALVRAGIVAENSAKREISTGNF